MKGTGIIILMLLVLLQSFSRWVIFANYQFNKEYIARNLCVNRNLPQMHCNGKCQMMKKLVEEEKTNTPAGSDKTKMQDTWFTQNINPPCIRSLPSDLHQYSSHYLQRSYTAPPSFVFHPPC